MSIHLTRAAGSVTTAKIAAAAVTSPKISRTVNDQTGTTYSFVLTDANGTVTANNASAQTFTIPKNIFAKGDVVKVICKGAGQVTLAAGSGTTVNGTPTLKSRAQKSVLEFECTDATTDACVFYVYGDLAAS